MTQLKILVKLRFITGCYVTFIVVYCCLSYSTSYIFYFLYVITIGQCEDGDENIGKE